MSEIKSTLDLVMERTRHLTLSAEEKAGQQKRDFEKKLNGLLQKYADRFLSADELVETAKVLQAESGLDGPKPVVAMLVERVQPGLDNAHWLVLIKRLAPAITPPLEQALAAYQDALTALAHKHEEQFLESLARDYGIQGSAVGPNLHKDDRFQEALADLKAKTLVRIESARQVAN